MHVCVSVGLAVWLLVVVVLLNVLGCRLTYKGQAETNAEAWFNIALCPRKPEGSLGRTAQEGHLDSHTAPELWLASCDLRSLMLEVCALQIFVVIVNGKRNDETSRLELGNNKRATVGGSSVFISFLFWWYVREAAGVTLFFSRILSTSFCDVEIK